MCPAAGRGTPWNIIWKTDAECWRGCIAAVGHREWPLLLDAGASDDESASRNRSQGELFCMEPVCVYAQSFSCVRLFVTPMGRGTHQAPLSVGFFRQEYWNRLPFPPPGDLPDPRDWTCVFCIGEWIRELSGTPLPAWSYLETLPNTPPPKRRILSQGPPFLVQLLSHIRLFCSPMDYSPPSSSVHGSYPTAGSELLHKDRWRQDISRSALWSDKILGNNQKGTGCRVQGAALALWVITSFSGPKRSCDQAGPLGPSWRWGDRPSSISYGLAPLQST